MCLILILTQRYAILSENWLGLIIKIGIGAVVYFALIFSFSSVSKKTMIFSLARKIVQRG